MLEVWEWKEAIYNEVKQLPSLDAEPVRTGRPDSLTLVYTGSPKGHNCGGCLKSLRFTPA
ncbi:MAG: hypothetical protein JXB88_13870 [Spirochaetales bacterium]|nr:hypothetical protein [Spirochaetales bacterium]